MKEFGTWNYEKPLTISIGLAEFGTSHRGLQMMIGQTIGPFLIEKELGSGAMGSVYRARYTKDDRIVALKVIAFGLAGNESALARFEREAEILKQLKHPNIVRLFATGRWRGTPFFAMEYVDGESLDRVMARRDRFSWQEVIVIGKQLAAALKHAHDKDIIHRDLKPSNLMVTRDGTLKLADFGIAKDIDRTALTGANSTIGTAAYMSPEQCRGEKHLTGKCDLYSLGIVFFELLAGKKPYYAESSVDMFLLHVNEPAPRVRNQPACMDVPAALETLVHQLMEKKPEHRPRDAAMVLQVLQEIEEKELARQSVGEQVSKGRKSDRVSLNQPDSDDLEAARSIRAGTKKKKLKVKKTPIYRQGWFVVAGSILIIVAMFGMAWWLTRPDSPDVMIQNMQAAKTPQGKVAAAKLYLEVYRNRPALKEKTELVQKVLRDESVKVREMALMKRYSKKGFRENPEEGEDPAAYKKTMIALGAEEEGDVVSARKNWKELEDKYAAESDETKAMWGWVAAKRLRDLDEVDNQERKLLLQIEDNIFKDADLKAAGEYEQRAVQALRQELFGDFSGARERWERISKDTEKEPEQRLWFFVAGKKSRSLDSKTPSSEERKALIEKKLAEAEKELKYSVSDEGTGSERKVSGRKGRNICREIRDLYSDVEPLKEQVQRAKQLLEKYPNK